MEFSYLGDLRTHSVLNNIPVQPQQSRLGDLMAVQQIYTNRLLPIRCCNWMFFP